MDAPRFSLPDQDGKTATLDNLRGKTVVLYFYPKADTPGCTTQACGIRDTRKLFDAAGAVVIGVSPDDVKDLKKFQQKFSLNFTLLADPETKTIQAYGVWREKQFMGRRYMGVMRTTFLIGPSGEMLKTYENVNPTTHADMILSDLHAMRARSEPVVKTSVVARKPAKKPVVKKTAVRRKPAAKKPAAKKTVKKTVKKSAAKKKK